MPFVALLVGMRSCSTSGFWAASLPSLLLLLLLLLSCMVFTVPGLLPDVSCGLVGALLSPMCCRSILMVLTGLASNGVPLTPAGHATGHMLYETCFASLISGYRR
jgi:hypothetical protein